VVGHRDALGFQLAAQPGGIGLGPGGIDHHDAITQASGFNPSKGINLGFRTLIKSL
jgi:hypothetical protein